MHKLTAFCSVSKRAVGSTVILALVFGAGIYVGLHQTPIFAQAPDVASGTADAAAQENSLQSSVDLSQFWSVWNLLNQNFVEASSNTPPTAQQKVYGAIEGLVASYGDPHSEFFPPSDATEFDQDISGTFAGIGAEMSTDENGNIIVLSPLKGSPAEIAGLKAGDQVMAIDGTSTAQMTLDDAVELIRGPQNSTVTLTVERQGQEKPLVIPIVRQPIQIPTIDYKNHADTGIFEIDLYNFSAPSADQFKTALRTFIQSGDSKLLLDLRGNPGGYLDAAVDIASYFLPANDTIVTEDFRGKEPNIVHKSLGYDVFADKNLTMAILVNQDTASAAEILSGALQQNGVAELVGTRTYGKGSVQELFNVGDGAQVKITVARWLTPNGSSIEGNGLTPNIEATTTLQDIAQGTDPQKAAAMQYLETH